MRLHYNKSNGQYFITLPKAVIKALQWKHKTELDIEIVSTSTGSGLTLRRK